MMIAADLPAGSRFLLDTNVLLRLQAGSTSTLDPYASSAVIRLQVARIRMHVTFQNISEFWNTCTRPDTSNGFGLSVIQTSDQLRRIKKIAPLIIDTRNVYDRWRHLLITHAVRGKQVHDTHLVASMLANDIQYLLTYNTKDFRRFRTTTAVHPQELA